MPLEIERKFLVVGEAWRDGATTERLVQGYLVASPELSIRVRRTGDRSAITIKGGRAGLVRSEYEYEIPIADGEELLRDLCAPPMIEKVRHSLNFAGRTWTVDEFLGAHAGLFLAEVELRRPDEMIALPPWAGREVTGDPAYQNSSLSRAGRTATDRDRP
jgi:adenylate cyclase